MALIKNKLVSIDQYTKITANKINSLFTKLEEIRKKLNVGNTISDTVATQNVVIPFTNNYEKKVQDAIKEIEKSKYVASTYNTRINIPSQVGDIIKTLEYYNNTVTVINDIIDLCIHDAAHKSADYSNYYTCENYYNAPCSKNSPACGVAYAGLTSGGAPCGTVYG